MGKRSMQSLGGEARAKALSPEERKQIASNAAASRWGIPKATHTGELKLGNSAIPVYVLEDGTRLISQRGLQGSVGMSLGGGAQAGARRIEQFLVRFEAIGNPYNEITARLNSPVVFMPSHGGRTAFGYEATVLTDLCEFFLMCRDAGLVRTGTQMKYVAVADSILRSVAKVGIIALIDEVTGYQEVRDKLALQKILELYINKELLKWAKRFPDDFYAEMFRLREWNWESISAKRPGQVGKDTNDLVYNRLAPGVLDELKRINPPDEKGRRKSRHHQWLTPDVGHPKLRDHLSGVIALMKVARSWAEFKRMMDKVYPKIGNTLELDI